MAKRYAVGDLVTVLPPFDNDPYIVRLQPHARIADVLPPKDGEAQYMIALLAVTPDSKHHGPFPARRLVPGHSAARS